MSRSSANDNNYSNSFENESDLYSTMRFDPPRQGDSQTAQALDSLRTEFSALRSLLEQSTRLQLDFQRDFRDYVMAGSKPRPKTPPSATLNPSTLPEKDIPLSIHSSGISVSSATSDHSSVASAASVKSVMTVKDVVTSLLHANQDKIIRFDKLDDSTVTDPPLLRDWYDRAVNKIVAKPYYAVLLNPDGSFKSPPKPNEDNELLSQLYSSLPTSIKAILRLSESLKRSGVGVLKYLKDLSAPVHSNHALADDLVKRLIDLKWDPKAQTLLEFATLFAELVNKLKTTSQAIPSDSVVPRWIRCMPPKYFTTIQHDFYESNVLPSGWSLTMDYTALYLQTNAYLQRQHPLLKKEKEKEKDKDSLPKEQIFATLPTGFQSYKKYKEHAISAIGSPEFERLKSLVPSNICPICLFKPAATKYHQLDACREYANRTGNSSSNTNNGNNTSVTHYTTTFLQTSISPISHLRQVKFFTEHTTSQIDPRNICFFDSGSKYHFFCDKSFFSEYHSLPSNTHNVLLGDNHTSLPVAGQGIADIIIPQTNIRLQLAAFHVPSLPSNFFSSIEHLQFHKCQAIGINNKYIITFPHGSFQVKSTDDYAFQILPGKHSHLPLSFSITNATLLPNDISPDNEHNIHISHLNRMTTRATTRQPPMEPIPEQTHDTQPPTTTTPTPNQWTTVKSKSRKSAAEFWIEKIANFNLPQNQKPSSNPFEILAPTETSDTDILAQTETSDTNYSPSVTLKQAFEYEPQPAIITQDNDTHSITSSSTFNHDPYQFYDTDSCFSDDDDSLNNDLIQPPQHPTKIIITNHPCDVFKYQFDNDDDSHKANKRNTKDTTTPVHTNTEQTDPISLTNDTNVQLHSTSTASHLHSHPTSKSSSSPEKLEQYLLTEMIHGMISPTTTTDPQYESEFNKAKATITPDEFKILNMLANSIYTRKKALKSSLPSDPRPTAHSSSYKYYNSDNMQQTTEDSGTSFQTLPFDHVPLSPLDRVNSTIPAHVTFTTEHLQHCTGFRNIANIKKQLESVIAETITISDLGRDPIKTRGEVATQTKKRRNTTPIARPDSVGDTIHWDIGFGRGTAIGGIRYVLFLVDRKSRKKWYYPLKDLGGPTILSQIQKFVTALGRYPKRMISDRDKKLLGEEVQKFLSPHTTLTGAPRNRQNQNGLAEINWRYVCDIARNYLSENLLPNKFWYLAIAYACQVTNYLPIRTDDGTITTPHFEAHGTKPDYRKLIPLFKTAYVKEIYSTDANNKFTTQTIPCILVGNDPQSDGQLFYNPATDSIIGSADYTLDTSHPSGPMFNLHYDGGLKFSLYDPSSSYNRPPKFELNSHCLIHQSHAEFPNLEVKIIHIPSTISNHYTALHEPTKTLIELEEKDLIQLHTSHNSTINPVLTIPWIQHKSKCTLILPDTWTTPKQGHLLHNDNKWYFLPGRDPESTSHKPIELHNFIPRAPAMIQRAELAQGWVTYSKFLDQYNTQKNQTYLLRRISYFGTTNPKEFTTPPHQISKLSRISASTLHSLSPPPNLKSHHKMHPTDKQIWDEAYLEEYLGLHETTHTWDYISESEYQALKKEIGRAIPTMALSKIKYDEHGKPERAKYRIVVLGNLDPTSWASNDCFAPVLSAMENRLLDAIAVHHGVIPKTGDFTQAFCQSYLPPNEKVVVLPPKDCPITPPNTYLLLRRTLYGLRRSPRHWYETAKKTFIQIGLKPLPNAPCIFTGTLINGQPPIYIGLYVDDFKYFSANPLVEQKLEQLISTKTSLHVTWEGPIHHFLGIKYSHWHDKDGYLTLHLSQQAAIEDLLRKFDLDKAEINTTPTPYRSGHPVDSIPHKDVPTLEKQKLISFLQEITGSFNWLQTQTRPDISTITSILSAYNSNPSPGHCDAAKYTAKYLKGTSSLGISFTNRVNTPLKSFVNYPVNPNELLPMTDANWGPQDASAPKPGNPTYTLDLWKTRSISGFIIWLGGPLHWQSKRQTITARSSAEAEIYAIDECTKCLQHITNILKDLDLFHIFTKSPIPIKNDNAAAVLWSHNMTTKGLRYIQIRENSIREQVQSGLIHPEHQSGETNIADIFTKEDKSTEHFLTIRDILMPQHPELLFLPSSKNQSAHPETTSHIDTHTFPSHSSNASVEGGVVNHVHPG